MPGDFAARIDQLKEIVGNGQCVGSLERDQVYAHYQHAGINRFSGGPLIYHQGGEALFQENALYDGSKEYLDLIAEQVLTAGPNEAMASAMEKLDDHARDRCPKELEILCNSGHPKVTSEGAVVYDRAPMHPRMTEGELRAAHEHVHRQTGGPSRTRRVVGR